MTKILIFIPTYNERDNAARMCREIHDLGLDADVLFVDDNSPDGTGKILDDLKPEFSRLIVQHRTGKLGIGSAHFDAIRWAYDQGYTVMVTMDCDFTHSPKDIPTLIAAARDADVSIGSRWIRANSLPGWNLMRRFMTWLGHFLTTTVLRVPQDASGAFRVYRLDRLPREIFLLVKTMGYSFFFESLFIFNRNGLSVVEIPIELPARTYGSSKMTASAALRSARYIFELSVAHLRRPEQFLLEKNPPRIDPAISDPQDWDSYWCDKSYRPEAVYEGTFYELIAGIYRRLVIKRNLERVIHGIFPDNSRLLHAGCGSGQVDVDLQRSMRITAADISPGALHRYARNNPGAAEVLHANIFNLPFPDETFDGVYNLGVMEHFTNDEIVKIFTEFRRILAPGGRIVIFWPHVYAPSVIVLNSIHFLFKSILKSKRKLHPAEISLSKGIAHVGDIIHDAGLEMIDYSLNWRDLFIQAIVVAQKK